MKPYHLSTRFYIIFTLVMLVPAVWLAEYLHVVLTHLFNVMSINLPFDWRLIEAPVAASVIAISFWIYEVFLWRFPPFKQFHPCPDINGHYEGHFFRSRNPGVQHDITFEIEQTLRDISIVCYGKERSSHSLVATIGQNGFGHWWVLMIYQNMPNEHFVQNVSHVHSERGVAFIEISKKGRALHGSYFTDPQDNGVYGTFQVKFKTNKKMADLEVATIV
ncbi:hypothetical protein EPO17_01165 [Patescibacteria group bacterium]|nr:MAG: hypothetical protein EPO17_01165 [Patescibacteria group bacterium]